MAKIFGVKDLVELLVSLFDVSWGRCNNKYS